MLKKYRFILSCVLLFASPILVKAQETEEEEVLRVPAASTSQIGTFKELNSYPESIRRSKPFARYLHRFERIGAENGTFDATARYEAFEESKSHLLSASAKQSKERVVESGSYQTSRKVATAQHP